jgi:hypothetical protein
VLVKRRPLVRDRWSWAHTLARDLQAHLDANDDVPWPERHRRLSRMTKWLLETELPTGHQPPLDYLVTWWQDHERGVDYEPLDL